MQIPGPTTRDSDVWGKALESAFYKENLQMMLGEPGFEKHRAGGMTLSLFCYPERGGTRLRTQGVGRAAKEVGAAAGDGLFSSGTALFSSGTAWPPSPSDHATARSKSSPMPSTPSL